MQLDLSRPSLCRSALSLGAAFGLAATTIAQVPINGVVASRFQGGQTTSPLGGLSVMDLGAPGTATSITGLGTDLTGSSSGLGAEGAASVLVDSSTGNLIVGEHALPGYDTDIHVLTLSGTSVVNDSVYTLGMAPGGGGWVDQMAWLGDDVVFTVRGSAFGSGAMMSHLVGVLRPRLGGPGTPGTITPVPMTALPIGYINALAVDEERGIAYFGMWQNNTLSEVYSVPVPGDGVTPATPALVATLPSGVLNLTIDGDGTILAGCVGAAGKLFRIDITQSPATVTPVSIGVNDMNGITMENVSGDIVFCDSGAARIYRWDQGSGLVPLGLVSGGASGVAVRQTMATYGRSTPGQNHYEWALAPNPGGAPMLGNTIFSMTTTSSPGSAALSAMLVSFGRGSITLVGAEFLTDLNSTVTQIIPSGPSVPFTLAIPNVAGLSGLTLTAQSAHFELGGGVTTSRGLELSLQTPPAPTINPIVPSAPLPNAIVTVTGTNFFFGMQLQVAGVPTPIVSQTSTTLTFVMPTGVLCDSSITLTNPGGGTATASLNGTPTITTMSSSGLAACGALFYILGNNLD
ncbi:MAG: IPT/TIG domain-containing protein, partial [Planctomycetes bacterium]|nr:IPT/TIG domain-containing protein [Planctomycetota bacterium]